MEYLYGASIHGIQERIFETNRLKEIRGASEIIEMICKDFCTFLGNVDIADKDFLLRAAGNIRLVTNKENVEEIVRLFPMKVAEWLPGVVVSQAVVEIKDGIGADDLECLIRKLKTQRNRIIKTAPIGCCVVKRAPRTGRPAYKKEKEELVDFSTSQKLKLSKNADRFTKMLLDEDITIEGNKVELASTEDNISDSQNKNWIAICHADGNGLGSVLMEIANQIKVKNKSSKEIIEIYQQFSNSIETANEEALKTAFKEIILEIAKKEKQHIVPFRPILLGGDDLTFICRADLAVPFVEKYVDYFQTNTKKHLQALNISKAQNGLTACAGIAFIKKSYPFHYGYGLADELCGYAKTVSKCNVKKDIIPSSVAFHKVQSSFHAGYEETVNRELRRGNVSFQFGPYSIRENGKIPQLSNIMLCARELQKEGAPKSGLRRWMDELKNEDAAQIMLRRVVAISGEKRDFDRDTFAKLLESINSTLSFKEAKLIVDGKTPVYDLLTLISIGV